MEKKIPYNSPEFQISVAKSKEDIITTSSEEDEWTGYY